MVINACIPVIPSADLAKSLRFWVDGIGLIVDQEMKQEGKLIGCMVHNEHNYFWLNQRSGPTAPKEYEGVRLYWTPSDIHSAHEQFQKTGFEVSEIIIRDYGQTEFFVTDDDGNSHCFGVATG